MDASPDPVSSANNNPEDELKLVPVLRGEERVGVEATAGVALASASR